MPAVDTSAPVTPCIPAWRYHAQGGAVTTDQEVAGSSPAERADFPHRSEPVSLIPRHLVHERGLRALPRGHVVASAVASAPSARAGGSGGASERIAAPFKSESPSASTPRPASGPCGHRTARRGVGGSDVGAEVMTSDRTAAWMMLDRALWRAAGAC